MFNIPRVKEIKIRKKDKESNIDEVPEELREDLEKALEECLSELREVEIKEKGE